MKAQAAHDKLAKRGYKVVNSGGVKIATKDGRTYTAETYNGLCKVVFKSAWS